MAVPPRTTVLRVVDYAGFGNSLLLVLWSYFNLACKLQPRLKRLTFV